MAGRKVQIISVSPIRKMRSTRSEQICYSLLDIFLSPEEFIRRSISLHWGVHRRFMYHHLQFRTTFLRASCRSDMRNVKIQGAETHLMFTFLLTTCKWHAIITPIFLANLLPNDLLWWWQWWCYVAFCQLSYRNSGSIFLWK